MAPLRSPLLGRGIGRQEAIDRAPGTQLAALVQSEGIDRAQGADDQTRAAEHLAELLPLRGAQCPRRRRSWLGRRRWAGRCGAW
jgi:hypothetical protein